MVYYLLITEKEGKTISDRAITEVFNRFVKRIDRTTGSRDYFTGIEHVSMGRMNDLMTRSMFAGDATIAEVMAKKKNQKLSFPFIGRITLSDDYGADTLSSWIAELNSLEIRIYE